MTGSGATRLIAIAIIGALVTACGSTSVTPAPTAAPTGQPGSTPAPTEDARRVEIRFANWFYQGNMEAVYNGYIEDFLAAEPRVTAVRVETTPFVRYHDVLNVQIAGGNAPHVAWINSSVGPQYVNSGRLLNLLPYIAEIPDYDLDDFGDTVLAQWKNGDELVALPFTNAGNVVFYNKDVFAAAGVPTPMDLLSQGRWDWANLKETARLIKASGAADWGFLNNNNIFTLGFRNLVEVWSAHGAAPWSPDGKTCTFNSPEAVRATQLYHDMIFADRSHPTPDVTADFKAGNIAMVMGRSSQIGGALGDATFEWEIMPLPSGPAGFIPSRAQNGIAVFADAPNADLAARFVVSTLTKEQAAKFSVNSPSPRQSVANVDAIASTTPYLTREQIERAIMPELTSEKFVFEYSHANYAAVERNANVVFGGKIWVEGANVKAGLDEVCATVQPLMAP
jgi:multiple sugar transport system substrate-binding protein